MNSTKLIFVSLAKKEILGIKIQPLQYHLLKTILS